MKNSFMNNFNYRATEKSARDHQSEKITNRKPAVHHHYSTISYENLILDARSLVLDDIADLFWNGIESKCSNENVSKKRKQNIQ